MCRSLRECLNRRTVGLGLGSSWNYSLVIVPKLGKYIKPYLGLGRMYNLFGCALLKETRFQEGIRFMILVGFVAPIIRSE